MHRQGVILRAGECLSVNIDKKLQSEKITVVFLVVLAITNLGLIVARSFMKIFFTLMFWAAVFGSAHAQAQTSLTTISNSRDPARPIRSDVQYEIKCPRNFYRLVINYELQEVDFSVDNASVSGELAASTLGALLRAKELLGHLGFSCGSRGVNITFLGFNINGLSAPQAVEYQGVVGSDGQVLMNTGLQPTTIRYLQQMWSSDQTLLRK